MAGNSRLDNSGSARLLTKIMRGALRTSVLAAFCLIFGAGAVSGQTKKTDKTKKKQAAQKPLENVSRTILSGRDSLVQIARRQLGLKYRLGASRPGKEFDCSSLVQWVAGLFGGVLPRTAAQQARVGIDVPKDTSHLLPGDLLYFGRGKKVTHIGIYVGEGKYLHASSTKKRVVETELRRTSPSFWKGARRIFLDVDSLFVWDRPATLKAYGFSDYQFSIPTITSIATADRPLPKQQGTH